MSTAASYRDQAFRAQPGLFDSPVGTDRVVGDHTDRAALSPATDSASAVPADQGTVSRDETYRAVKHAHDHDRNLWFGRIVAKGRRGVTLDELSAEHHIPRTHLAAGSPSCGRRAWWSGLASDAPRAAVAVLR